MTWPDTPEGREAGDAMAKVPAYGDSTAHRSREAVSEHVAYVRKGQTPPAVFVKLDRSQLLVASPAQVRRRVDGGAWEVVEIDERSAAIPTLEVGEHTVEWEIDWKGGITERVPYSGPQRVVVSP